MYISSNTAQKFFNLYIGHLESKFLVYELVNAIVIIKGGEFFSDWLYVSEHCVIKANRSRKALPMSLDETPCCVAASCAGVCNDLKGAYYVVVS